MEQKLIKRLIVLGVPGVALGIFYLLLKRFNFQFSQIDATFSGLIVVIFLLLVGIVTLFALHRWSPKQSIPINEKQEGKADSTFTIHPRRYLDQPQHLHFIKSLPESKKIAHRSAQELWDTGITADMRQGSQDYMDFLKNTWVKLTEFFPPLHFGSKEPRQYLSEYIQSRYAHHRANLEPHGVGTGGTIIGVMADGHVMADLEKMIEEIVCTISLNSETFDFLKWKSEWANKA